MTHRIRTLTWALVLTACASTQETDIAGLNVTVPDAGGQAAGNTGGGGTPTNGGGNEAGGAQTGSGGASTGGATSSGNGGSVGDVVGSGGRVSGDMNTGGGPSDGSGGLSRGSGGISPLPGSGGACGLGQKRCAGACVSPAPSNGCSGTSCSECANTLPDNAERSCSFLGQCDFTCNQGFRKNNGACVSMNGTGGAGGSGGMPSTDGGEVVCNGKTCRACPDNQIGCCGTLDNCLCVLPNLTNLCR